MENRNFYKQFEVHYYEINQHKEVTPVAILNYLEDTAIAHSAHIGYGIDRLLAEGKAWVINRWRVDIMRYPLLGERIRIETWPSKFERFFATREYLIKDSSGEIIVKAASLWILLNIAKKRPIRVPSELAEAYGLSDDRAIQNPFTELPVLEEPAFGKEFYIRRSDIDTNNHVNNTRYLDWVLESIPQEIYDKCKLVSLEIIYKREGLFGSVIKSQCRNLTDGEFLPCYVHSIVGHQGEELASAKTTWRYWEKN